MIDVDRYIHVMMEESEGFKEWKNLIETLTVDWLIENCESSHRKRLDLTGIVGICTYAGILEMRWENTVYVFSSPAMRQSELTFTEDKNLVRYLSTDVLEEFIKVIEL